MADSSLENKDAKNNAPAETEQGNLEGIEEPLSDVDSACSDDMAEASVIQVLEKERECLQFLNGTEYLNLEDLPIEVQRRIQALKKNQLEITKVEAKFYSELHDLECKYSNLMKEHFVKRRDIVSGSYEPLEEECVDASTDAIDTSDLKVPNACDSIKVDTDDNGNQKQPEPSAVGIPYFWTNIFNNVDILTMMADDSDDEIIRHLLDIEIEMMKNPMGFKLHFHFSPNEYFTNSVLTKTYEMKCDPNPEDPFSYEGTEIYKCSGCTIDWKEGKNATVKILNKRQKHKQSGAIRTVTETIKDRSFFNFFDPPKLAENSTEEMDEEMKQALTTDFEIGQYLRERIIPRAYLYFTGEALDEDEDDDDFSEEEEQVDSEEDAEEDTSSLLEHGDHSVYL